MTKRNLDDLRREIDAIDDQIHDLLLKRWETVRHVAEAKGASMRLPIRPAREAAMLRRLAARHRGPFPFAALARMWHEMIAAFTMLQARYSIAVLANAQEHALWDLARDQFGSQVPMTAYPTQRDALAQLFEGRHDVAVLPMPREGEEDPWWVSLAGAEAPKIVMRIPFAGVGSVRGQMQDALAVAHLALEPTGSDRTLIVVETKEPVSRTGLNAILQRANLLPRFTASAHRDDGWYHLIELGDFVEVGDRRLELIDVRDVVRGVSIVGAYAEILGREDMAAPDALEAPKAPDQDTAIPPDPERPDAS
ncbi:chorismate mutase [Marivibrio halodurans]|uniref:chorismate mutase n=1 Tax=Marivibrio halodurans TaxID=2039722 RepID=A0A8J7S0M7_9PROT|nr:chorismate mutase [Marivibrio halodurans]MBP5856483.1 chorismate mutase [Marivibrio halodurans]